MDKKSFNQMKQEESLRKDSTAVGEMHEEPAMARVMANAKRRPEPKAISDEAAHNMSPPALKAAMLKEKIKDIRSEIAESTKDKRKDESCEKCGDKGHEVAKCWMGKSLKAQEMAKADKKTPKKDWFETDYDHFTYHKPHGVVTYRFGSTSGSSPVKNEAEAREHYEKTKKSPMFSANIKMKTTTRKPKGF